LPPPSAEELDAALASLRPQWPLAEDCVYADPAILDDPNGFQFCHLVAEALSANAAPCLPLAAAQLLATVTLGRSDGRESIVSLGYVPATGTYSVRLDANPNFPIWLEVGRLESIRDWLPPTRG
jgi:hypothetical protein